MKNTTKKLSYNSLTIGLILILLLIAFWLYKNYPRFYCPEGKHKAYNMMQGYYCSTNGSPEID